MKTTRLEMGLIKLQAETIAESQALNGVLEMIFRFMPESVCNYHGMNGKKLTYCVVPDGTLTGEGESLTPGIESRLAVWKKLPPGYKFRRA